jgi:hypothetical protein
VAGGKPFYGKHPTKTSARDGFLFGEKVFSDHLPHFWHSTCLASSDHLPSRVGKYLPRIQEPPAIMWMATPAFGGAYNLPPAE